MKKYSHFAFIFIASFLLWVGCKCNDCPPTFEETKNGCKCPEKQFKLNGVCRELPKDMYYLPFEDAYCFDTMFVSIDPIFCDSNEVICDQGTIVWYNRGGGSSTDGIYFRNSILGDSIHCLFLDQCILKNAPTLGLKGRKHKDDGKWHCTVFLWDYKTGPAHPFEEREVILQK